MTETKLPISQEQQYKYKYCGTLPISYDPIACTVVVLLGRELIVDGWSESGKWSDWGGTPEKLETKLETPLETSARETSEEMMDMLGTYEELKDMLTNKGKCVELAQFEEKAAIWLLPIKFQPDIGLYFNRVYNYLRKCTRSHPEWKGAKYIPTCPKGYIEKCEMKWFPLSAIKTKSDIFRSSFLISMEKIIPIIDGLYPTIYSTVFLDGLI